MGQKVNIKVPEQIQKEWDEARLCAKLLRQGAARIVIATRRDRSTFRYTKPR